MRTLISFAAVIVCSVITGCTTQVEQDPHQQLMEEAREFSVVAVTNPAFTPSPGAKFAWFSPLIWSSDVVQYNTAQSQEIMGILEAQIKEKGYTIVANAHDADYVIGAAIADGDSELSHELTHFFNLFPSLGKSRLHHDKSTLYLGVIHANDVPLMQDPDHRPEVLWRSSIQAYILGDEISPELSHLRLQAFGRKVMYSFP